MHVNEPKSKFDDTQAQPKQTNQRTGVDPSSNHTEQQRP